MTLAPESPIYFSLRQTATNSWDVHRQWTSSQSIQNMETDTMNQAPAGDSVERDPRQIQASRLPRSSTALLLPCPWPQKGTQIPQLPYASFSLRAAWGQGEAPSQLAGATHSTANTRHSVPDPSTSPEAQEAQGWHYDTPKRR